MEIGQIYLYLQQDGIEARWFMAAIYGPPPTMEPRGPPEPHPEIGIGTLYLYHPRESIKAR